MSIIFAKVLLAVGGTVAFGVGYHLRQRIMAWPRPVADRWLVVLFVLCRLVPFLIIYVGLNLEPRSDVPVFYEAARHALLGEVVYRDFNSPYSPLFAYVTALPLILWHSAKAITLLMIVVEGLAWWLTYRFYRPRLGPVTQLAALLYLLLSGPFVFCVLGGQEDVWMWAFGVASLWLWAAKPDAFWLGILMAVALLITKALAVLIAVALLFWVRRPGRYLAGLLTVGVPALVVLYALTGAGMFSPLMFASMPFAPNLPTVLAPLTGDFMPYTLVLSAVGLLAVLGLSAYGGWQLRRHRVGYEYALPVLWVLCYCFMMFIHKSSLGNYTFIYLLPLLFVLIKWENRWQVLMLLVLNFLVTIQPSFWWSLGTPLFVRLSLLTDVRYLTEYLMEVGIVLSIGYFVWLAYRRTKGRFLNRNRFA